MSHLNGVFSSRLTVRSGLDAWILLLTPAAILSAPAIAAPPTVIRTVPVNGDQNVDPALAELLVEFDQDMEPGGYSWTGGGETFPKMMGKPRWTSPRICVLPVQLQPGHEYVVGINSARYRNFRSKSGESATPVPINFRTRGGSAPATVPTAEQHRLAVAELRKLIDESYSYRDLRGVDWNNQFRDHEAAMLGASSAEDFARKAAEMLKAAGDLHVFLEVDGNRIGTTGRALDPNFSPDALARTIPTVEKINNVVAVGEVEGRIGYILIASWEASRAEELEAAAEALSRFAGFSGLVIDVRPNSGGSEPLAQQFVGPLIDSRKVYAKHVTRDPSQPGGWTKVFERTIEPAVGGPKFKGRVAVLMGRKNMSSAEAFLLMMRQVPGCRSFGESSFGSSGNPQPHPLPNGVTVYLPSWKAMTADGKEFEGKGIEPDVTIKTTPADFRDRDPVLEAALKWLHEPA